MYYSVDLIKIDNLVLQKVDSVVKKIDSVAEGEIASCLSDSSLDI